jgi:diacylglycerol kinase family enzyme
VTAAVEGEGPRQRWLARASLLFVAAAALLVIGFAHDLRGVLELALGVVLMVASAYLFLAHRGPVRMLVLLVLLVTPVVLGWRLVQQGLLAPLVVAVLLLMLAVVSGRAALGAVVVAAMPEYDVPAPRHPFLLMNPRSGGGKVARFGLKEKAERLGAEVMLLDASCPVDVAAVARDAVARGADLLGVAGGDGTQALVAGVAAEHDVPFVVLSAGTRNHFALDLGLDREDPAAGLAALTDDAVELHVDLGQVGERTFVNNASFGAYAQVVQSPAYRDDKARTTLALLPDLLSGAATTGLTAHAEGATIENPQAVLVSVNPYGTGDVAGLGRRTRLDSGLLGVAAVRVESARQAVRLLYRASERGLTVLTTSEVVITADAAELPVGVDGEAVMMPTPVRCAIRPQALRVRVPRARPGMARRRAHWSWLRLRRLASFKTTGSTTGMTAGRP